VIFSIRAGIASTSDPGNLPFRSAVTTRSNLLFVEELTRWLCLFVALTVEGDLHELGAQHSLYRNVRPTQTIKDTSVIYE
jgi:hypothetical protein